MRSSSGHSIPRCLGAPLSGGLLLSSLECVVGDATKHRTEQEGTASPLGHFSIK